MSKIYALASFKSQLEQPLLEGQRVIISKHCQDKMSIDMWQIIVEGAGGKLINERQIAQADIVIETEDGFREREKTLRKKNTSKANMQEILSKCYD